jgi:GMP synthase-like glutamine amidotransferase
MPLRILVLQHIACEPPAVYEDVMRERGAEIVRVELDEGETAPDWRGFDAVVAMGGPMGAYEEADHPWLVGEKTLIREAVTAGVPFFGACLGVQLLAAALGANVYPGPVPEVGVCAVSLTADGAADPLFAGLPGTFRSLQWHGDTFDLPDGAVRLAESDAYANQAFRVGEFAYGLQFHLEVDETMGTEWATVPAYEQSAEAALGPGGLDGVLRDFRTHAAEMQAHARLVIGRFLDLVERRSAARTGDDLAVRS